MDYFPKQSIYVSNLKNKIIETMRTFLLNGQDSNLSELSLMVLETILVDHLSTAQCTDVLFVYPLNNIKYCCKTSLKIRKNEQMWARQDSNLQSIQGVDLQSTRLPITGYVPKKKQMCIFTTFYGDCF